MGDTPAQTRSERVLEQPNELPLSEGHTSGSREGRMEHTVELTDTVPPTPYDSPLTRCYTPRTFITLTKRVKKLETQLKQKRSRAVIHSSDEEEPSLDIKDSPKHGRIIEKWIKMKMSTWSTTKDNRKGIMQETEIPKKIKKREMIQLSLDEELSQNLYAKELAKETSRQEQEKYNLEKALKLKRQLDKREENVDKGDQTQEIDWNDPKVLRYHALHNRVFSKAEKQKLDEQTEVEVEAQVNSNQKVEEMKLYMRIVPDEEIAIYAIPLATKPPVIVEYKIFKEGKINTYHIIRADGSTKRFTSMINFLENINREDLETLWKLVKDKHGNTRPEEGYERVL
nr:hypothetical protein [Tanacetum cinerariifolium]